MARLSVVERDLRDAMSPGQKVDQEVLRRVFRTAADAGLTPAISPVMRAAVKHLEAPLQTVFDAHKADEELLKRALKDAEDAGLTAAMSRLVQQVQAHLMKLIIPRNRATHVCHKNFRPHIYLQKLVFSEHKNDMFTRLLARMSRLQLNRLPPLQRLRARPLLTPRKQVML